MRALLIDGLNLVRRIFAGVPGDEQSDEHLEAVAAAVGASVQRALNEFTPTHGVCIFDGEGTTWRHALLPTYKSERPAMPSALGAGLSEIKARIQDADIACLSVPGFEADDVVASIAVRIAARGGECVVLSTDTSFCQILRPGIRIRDHFAGRDLDARYVADRFKVKPNQLADWLALVGNPSLSIAGVKGIGAKTASKLLTEHDTLETVLNNAEHIPGRAGKLLLNGRDDALRARQLVGLKADVKLGMNLNQFRRFNVGDPA